jgi:hypothetical protein
LTKHGWKERLVDVDTTTPLGTAGAGTGGWSDAPHPTSRCPLIPRN